LCNIRAKKWLATRHTAMLSHSHGQLVTSQLVTRVRIVTQQLVTSEHITK